MIAWNVIGEILYANFYKVKCNGSVFNDLVLIYGIIINFIVAIIWLRLGYPTAQ